MNQHDDIDEEDGWECPTCLRPMQDEHDYECGTCERKASEHLRVTTLCRLLRETQQRESSLIVQLGDAKATADLWMKHAKMADESAADLKAELADTKRHWKEETEEQARLLGMSAERECDLRGELQRERALADRLADALRELCHTFFWKRDISEESLNKAERVLADWVIAFVHRDQYGGQLIDSDCDCAEGEYLEPIDAALAAWKEARSE